MPTNLAIAPPDIRATPGGFVMSSRWSTPDGAFDLEVTVDGLGEGDFPPPEALTASLHAFALLPAMANEASLSLPGSLSPRLRYQSDRLQEILANFHAETVHPVAVECAPAPAGAAAPLGDRERGTAAFLSGGLHSLFTVARNRPTLTHVVFVEGADHPLRRKRRLALIGRNFEACAEKLGLRPVRVRTNVRRFVDRRLDHHQHYSGPLLAGVAHLLSGAVGKVMMAASLPHRAFAPIGTTPITDPLYGDDHLEIVHDGAEATRLDKAAVLADLPAAKDHLCVCRGHSDTVLNCGKCGKCLRVLACLRASGVLDRFAHLFAAPLDLGMVAGVVPTPVTVEAVWRPVSDHLHATGADRELMAAVDEMLARHDCRRLAEEIRLRGPGAFQTPPVRRLWPKIRRKVIRSIIESDPDWFTGRLARKAHRLREPLLRMLRERQPSSLKTRSPGPPPSSK